MTYDESEITVRLKDMSPALPGMVSLSPDGHINIYINSRLNDEGRKEALEHELEHVENDDLYSNTDIQTVETRNHKPLPRLFRAIELLPKPEPSQRPMPPEETCPVSTPLQPHQVRAVMNAISELDRCFFGDTDDILALYEP